MVWGRRPSATAQAALYVPSGGWNPPGTGTTNPPCGDYGRLGRYSPRRSRKSEVGLGISLTLKAAVLSTCTW